MTRPKFSRIAVNTIGFAILSLLLSIPAFPQSSTGRITGVVTDPASAVVAGAKVAVKNAETGELRSTVTGSDGRYLVLELPIGNYTVSVQAPGFETALTAPNEMQINETVRVDIHLALGSVSQTVAVEAEAPQVETENPTIGTTVTGDLITEMPLNGRDPMSLLSIMPGYSGGVIAGGRSDNVTYLLDGGTNNVGRGGNQNFDTNPDTIEEFRVLMNNYTAEYGRAGGGVVSVVTKSGTNSLHGTLFEYVRNTDFNANNFFLNSTGQPRAILQRNQFGFTVGGPIIIPKVVHGKNKLFFFMGYQGQRQNQNAVGSVTNVATPLEATGNFSQAINGKPDPLVVAYLQKYPYFQSNPALAAQGIINPAMISPVFSNFLAAGLIVTSPTGTIVPSLPSKTNYGQYTGKADYVITQNDRVSVTNGYQSNPSVSAGNIGFPLANYTLQNFAAIDYTKTIRPTLVNDLRASLNRFVTDGDSPTTKTPGPAALGITGVTPDVVLGSPIISVSNYESLGYNPNNSHLRDNQYGYSDTLTWIKGRHTFKGGLSLTFEQENSIYNYETDGDYVFSGASTTIGSGNAMADFIMGMPDEFAQYPTGDATMRQHLWAGFFQDEWKVRRNLELTIGLRYEYNTPQRDLLGRSFSLEPGVQSTRFVSAPLGAVFPGDPGAPQGLYFPDKLGGFAPRLGIAWDPFGNGKTSIRSGFGIFHNLLDGWAQDWNDGASPFYAGVTVTSNLGNPLPAGSIPPPYMTSPWAANNLPNPFPSHELLSSSDPNLLAKLADLPFGASAWFDAPHLKMPIIYQYNLSIERQLVKNLALDVSYVGSDSHRLDNEEDQNPIVLGTNTRLLNVGRYPYVGGTDNGFAALANYTTNDGAATYNGLLSSLTKRFGDSKVGTTFFTAAFTWSHNIDNGGGSVNSTSGNIPYYEHDALRANSTTDRRLVASFAGGWELPFAKAWASGPKNLIGGWTLYPNFSASSGAPFSISAGLKESSVGNKPGPSGAGDLQIVNALQTGPIQFYNQNTPSTVTVGSATRTGFFYFNPNDFTVPSTWNTTTFIPAAGTYTYGMPRDSIPGIPTWNLDMALGKKFTLFKERTKWEFRVEEFNAPNHLVLSSPTTSRTSTQFGQITSAGASRVGQLALRLQF